MFHYSWLPCSSVAFLHNDSLKRGLRSSLCTHVEAYWSIYAILCLRNKWFNQNSHSFSIFQQNTVRFNALNIQVNGICYLVGNVTRTGQWCWSFSWQQTFPESVFKWLVKTTISGMMLHQRHLTFWRLSCDSQSLNNTHSCHNISNFLCAVLFWKTLNHGYIRPTHMHILWGGHDTIHVSAICPLRCKLGITFKVPDGTKGEHLPAQVGLRQRTAVRFKRLKDELPWYCFCRVCA